MSQRNVVTCFSTSYYKTSILLSLLELLCYQRSPGSTFQESMPKALWCIQAALLFPLLLIPQRFVSLLWIMFARSASPELAQQVSRNMFCC